MTKIRIYSGILPWSNWGLFIMLMYTQYVCEILVNLNANFNMHTYMYLFNSSYNHIFSSYDYFSLKLWNLNFFFVKGLPQYNYFFYINIIQDEFNPARW